MRSSFVIAVVTIVGTATSGLASPFFNGSFESPGTVGVFLSDGSTYITGWTSGGGSGFDYSLTTQQDGGVIPPQAALVEALDGATVLNSVTNSFNPDAGVWIGGATLSFVATSTSTTLRFTDQTTSENSVGVNWALDDVTVAAVSGGAVPEPATGWLFTAALALFAPTLMRRARRS